MRYTLAFDASDSSNIYSSNIVQPAACQILIIIKVWNAAGWRQVFAYVEFDLFAENFMTVPPKSLLVDVLPPPLLATEKADSP